MKLITELTDQTVLGLEGLSKKKPRRTSRAIVINDEGLYAVVYTRRLRLHSLPGGGIERGETEEEALKREILEETGCECERIEPLGKIFENRGHANHTALSYYYVVHTSTKNGKPHYTKGEMYLGTSIKWCTFEEAEHLIKDVIHDTEQKKFLQARDVAALREYRESFL